MSDRPDDKTTQPETRPLIEQILESITDAFFTVDKDWRFVYVNQQAADLWNRGRESLIGQNIWEVLPLSYETNTYKQLHQALQARQVQRFETLGPYTQRWFAVTAFPTPEGLSVYFQDITDRKRNENAQRFLVNVSTLLGSSLDYETTFQHIARLAVPDIADWCMIDQLDENNVVHLVAVAHIDPAKAALAQELRVRYPIDPKQLGYEDTVFQRKSLLVTDIPDEALVAASYDAEHLRISRALGLKSSIVVPIIGYDRVLGLITFIAAESGRRYDAQDVSLAEELARRSAWALENARLYQDVQEQRQRLQVTLASIGDGVIATDLRGRITFMNGVAEALTGWLASDAIGLNLPRVFQIVNEKTRAVADNPIDDVFRQKTAVKLPNLTMLLANDGAERIIDGKGALIQDEQGKLLGAILIFRDVTERRQTEAMLGKSLTRTWDLYNVSRRIGLATTPDRILRALLTSQYTEQISQAAILAYDTPWKDHRPTTYEVLAILNPEASLPGLAEDGRLNKSLLSALLSPERSIFIDNIQVESGIDTALCQAFYAAKMGGVALIPLITAGECFGVLVFYSPPERGWSEDDVRHIQIFIEQISSAIQNIRLLEAEARARREAEKANELKLQFLAMISHELRTPLTPIKGFSTTLLSTDVVWDAESQRNFIGIIDEEADKLTDLIEQLLDLSRLAAGQLSIRQERHHLKDIVDLAMPQLGFLTSRHQLIIDISADLPFILVDAPRIAQVLGNLVGNAAKYAPLQSAIRLAAVAIVTEIQIDVIDQGPGIPRQDRQLVFEAFRQLDSAKNQKGAGLGLAICKGLVEAHGGRIWIADQDQPGTTVSFTLPAMS